MSNPLPAVVLVGLLLTALQASAFSGQAPTGRTGAPQGQTCSSCHGGGGGSGNLSIEFPSLNEYNTGQTYELGVRITSNTTRQRWGFAIVARDADNNTTNVGTWAATGSNTVITGSGEVGHSNAPVLSATTFTFNVSWTAPDSAVGDITFYAAGVAANNNSSSSQDDAYHSTLTISEATNQAPVVTTPGIASTVTSGYSLGVEGISIADADAGEGELSVSLNVGEGTLQIDTSVSGVTIADNGSASVTLQGKLDALSALFSTTDAIVYTPSSLFIGEDTLSISANDNGHTGPGADRVGFGSVTIQVVAPPALEGFSVVDANTFQFNLSGRSGTTYLVEHSTDLQTWILIGEVTIVGDPQAVTDDTISGVSRRFYRAREKPP